MKRLQTYLLCLIILGLSVFLLTTHSSLLTTIYAQCQTNDRNTGLISAVGGITGDTLFGNLDQVCIINTQDASYRAFKVPTYQDLEDQFYTLTRSLYKKGALVSPGPLTGAVLDFTGPNTGDGIYLHIGDLTINDVRGLGNQIIFVRGNLNITGNIGYAAGHPGSGLVFVVKDNINIYSTVFTVNAVLISSGIMCTAYDNPTSACLDGTVITPRLTVYGSLISLNKTPLAAGTSSILLRRNLTVNTQPAEIFNKLARYLYNLRNGLFTRDLIITTEDAHFDIGDPGPPPPPILPPPTCVSGGSNPLPIPLDQAITGCITIP